MNADIEFEIIHSYSIKSGVYQMNSINSAFIYTTNQYRLTLKSTVGLNSVIRIVASPVRNIL